MASWSSARACRSAINDLVIVEVSDSGPNSALFWSVLAALAAVLWFALKHHAGLAGQAPHGRFAANIYARADPWVQTLRVWAMAAPVTLIYVITWTVTTVILQGTPTALAGVLNRFNSTNIFGFVNEPVRVMFASAFIVADYGFFYLGYVVFFVLVVARLEQRIGSARFVLIGFGAHVGASLIIVGLESLLIRHDVLARSTEITQDVGVSYVMVGAAGAYLFLVGTRLRWWYLAALVVAVVGPVVAFRTLWDLGHLLALIWGIGIFGIVSAYGTRPPLKWRQCAASRAPRELPTFTSAPPVARRSGDGVTSLQERIRKDDD